MARSGRLIWHRWPFGYAICNVTYRKFITELWDSQMVPQKTELTEKLMKQIYDLSAGIPSYIVKIFQEAQVQAILTGKEKLSYEVLKQAVLCL